MKPKIAHLTNSGPENPTRFDFFINTFLNYCQYFFINILWKCCEHFFSTFFKCCQHFFNIFKSVAHIFCQHFINVPTFFSQHFSGSFFQHFLRHLPTFIINVPTFLRHVDFVNYFLSRFFKCCNIS
jgi:hypothetical protein